MQFLPAELIKKKRSGESHSLQELEFIVNSFTAGKLPDYQMSAWLMAVFFKGMTAMETSQLTQVMLHSGKVLDFSGLGFAIDKHSTGGVGDKTSLILAPIVAAAGIPVPMIAGRGLGHTGGTLDKLESIPGFNVHLSLDAFQKQVAELGFALIGQTAEICPADKKIYALRDVTATVESMPLICASIMSKKLAEGIQGLVLDVKHGNGAFMKTEAEAEQLARSLMQIGEAQGKNVSAFLTDMNQPLGRLIGNSLEIEETLAILENKPVHGIAVNQLEDCRQLSLELAGAMIHIAGKATDHFDGVKIATNLLMSGKAREMFEQMCARQGGNLKLLPQANYTFEIRTTSAGFVSRIETEKLGYLAIRLGAGRLKSTDQIVPTNGFIIHKKLGEQVQMNDILFTVFCNDKDQASEVETVFRSCVTISLQKFTPPSLITKVITHSSK